MDSDSIYYRQVQLLVRALPYVAKERCFALKGGTAINLFIRDLPRLSVDIDLAYLPLDDRNTALKNMDEALDRIANEIRTNLPGIRTQKQNEKDGKRILVTTAAAAIKIEASPVLRGHVFPPQEMSTVEIVEETFGFADIQLLSFQDIYAGKICAALDRQHARDLYDIKVLLENEGIDRDLFKTFLVYLISHGRPIVELLAPNLIDLSETYKKDFEGMTEEKVSLEELEKARENLIKTIRENLTPEDKSFLLSVKSGKPDWDLLELDNIEKLPAVRWKLQNIAKMPEQKHKDALEKLRKILEK